MNIKEQKMAIEITIPEGPCVYFLTDSDGEILYIGKSRNGTIGRIATHQYGKEFNRAFFVNCFGYKKMDELESKLILKYRPKYNMVISNKNAVGMMGVVDIKKQIDVDLRVIKKAAHIYGIEMVAIGNSEYYETKIIDAIKKYIKSLKRCPLSLDYKLWKNIRTTSGKDGDK
jgi:hypothetical protein